MKKELSISLLSIFDSFRPIVQQGATMKPLERSDGVMVTVTFGGKDSAGKAPASVVFSQLKSVSGTYFNFCAPSFIFFSYISLYYFYFCLLRVVMMSCFSVIYHPG